MTTTISSAQTADSMPSVAEYKGLAEDLHRMYFGRNAGEVLDTEIQQNGITRSRTFDFRNTSVSIRFIDENLVGALCFEKAGLPWNRRWAIVGVYHRHPTHPVLICDCGETAVPIP